MTIDNLYVSIDSFDFRFKIVDSLARPLQQQWAICILSPLYFPENVRKSHDFGYVHYLTQNFKE